MPTMEKTLEIAKKALEEAKVGTGGLKRIMNTIWRPLSAELKRELLEKEGAIVLTGWGEDEIVEMRFEDYFAICPATNNPLKKPRMKMFEGHLFREVM